ncbi:MAG: hypothetical protein H7Y07_12270 [Pyrinomonadaceae bacterium]|nr:hypothetical protein [Sphingobacteriaceae bacterium]
MKKVTLKLVTISACLALSLAACSSNKTSEGMADSDSTMMGMDGMSTDTMMTDTATSGWVPRAGTTTTQKP